MISILPSEGLAPSQSAPKQNKLSDASSKSDEPSFSSLVSRDSSEGASDPDADAPVGESALADQSEPAAKTPRANGASGLTGREPIDPAILAPEEAAPQTTDADLPRAPAPAALTQRLRQRRLYRKRLPQPKRRQISPSRTMQTRLSRASVPRQQSCRGP